MGGVISNEEIDEELLNDNYNSKNFNKKQNYLDNNDEFENNYVDGEKENIDSENNQSPSSVSVLPPAPILYNQSPSSVSVPLPAPPLHNKLPSAPPLHIQPIIKPPSYKIYQPPFTIKKKIIEVVSDKKKIKEYIPKVSEIILERFTEQYGMDSNNKPRKFQILNITKKSILSILENYNIENNKYINKKTKDVIGFPDNLIDYIQNIFDKTYLNEYDELINKYVNLLLSLYININREYDYDDKEGKIKEKSRLKELLELFKNFMSAHNYNLIISKYKEIPTKASLNKQQAKDTLQIVIKTLYDSIINKPDLDVLIKNINELKDKPVLNAEIDDLTEFQLDQLSLYKKKMDYPYDKEEEKVIFVNAFESVYNGTATIEQYFQIYDYFSKGPKPLIELLSNLTNSVDKKLKSININIDFPSISKNILGGYLRRIFSFKTFLIILLFMITLIIIYFDNIKCYIKNYML